MKKSNLKEAVTDVVAYVHELSEAGCAPGLALTDKKQTKLDKKTKKNHEQLVRAVVIALMKDLY